MSFKDQIAFCKIKLELSPFQALGIFLILQIEINMCSKNIFANKIEYKKVKYLIFCKFVANIIKNSNV